jgi:hypothetical protein
MQAKQEWQNYCFVHIIGSSGGKVGIKKHPLFIIRCSGTMFVLFKKGLICGKIKEKVGSMN